MLFHFDVMVYFDLNIFNFFKEILNQFKRNLGKGCEWRIVNGRLERNWGLEIGDWRL